MALSYNVHTADYEALYCEDCGWIACFTPEAMEEGSLCTACGHTLGTSGSCYDYATGEWNTWTLDQMWGESKGFLDSLT